MKHPVIGVGIAGTELSELEAEVLRENLLGAVILFARNVESADQLSGLVESIRMTAIGRPLILIDQEGGRVDRLRAVLGGLPGAESIAESNDSERLAREFGRILGLSVAWFGIDVNLAPVIDIERDEPTRGLERRTFGSSSEEVLALAARFIEGQTAAGVASCLKHFPGLGRARTDTHYGPAIVDASLDELQREDLVPFMRLADRSGAVMVSHATYPQIDPMNLPATVSPAISGHLLREVVAFDGVAMTDDMEMHAVADLGSYEELSERALLAGNDLVLFCSHIERVPELTAWLERRADADEQLCSRVEEAAGRVSRYAEACGRIRRERSESVASFEELMSEIERFREEFARLHPDPASGSAAEQRATPREKRGGKTGREEWT